MRTLEIYADMIVYDICLLTFFILLYNQSLMEIEHIKIRLTQTLNIYGYSFKVLITKSFLFITRVTMSKRPQ